VTATADAGPPIPLFEQLAPGAALVCPVRASDGEEQLMRYRDGVGEAVVPVRFVPLVEEPPGE
jgi:protein-L-isoaspartate(D-aspartate) O-methyltransferase